jgi:hypothetical protein
MLHLALAARCTNPKALPPAALVQIHTLPSPAVRSRVVKLACRVELLPSASKVAPVGSVHFVAVPATLVGPSGLAPVQAGRTPGPVRGENW